MTEHHDPQRFRVSDYGAVSEQHTDGQSTWTVWPDCEQNRQAYRRAVEDAQAAGGGTVYLDAGYWNGSKVAIVPSNVRIRGSGRA
jgi:polygalacturonase